MLFSRPDTRLSIAIRIVILGLVAWSVIGATHHPSTSGRGLAVTILFAVCVAGMVAWVARRDADAPPTVDTYLLAIAGGALTGASPESAASAFAFVAVIAAGVKGGVIRGLQVAAVAALALAITVLIWDGRSIGLLAYALGFGGAALAGANAREVRLRAETAELLLAQTQRSQEEGLRAARLAESTRIAREIHDVLAHALAGLTIQLEATAALVEAGADSAEVLARVQRAHELARDGLRETRRAVGALRDGGEVPVLDALRALTDADGAALRIDGDGAALSGELGLAVLRVVQESLTNATKHAPGSAVEIEVSTGGGAVTVTVDSRSPGVPVPAGGLADSGGGYGIAGMRERATALGGTLAAGPTSDGWRVRLTIPARHG